MIMMMMTQLIHSLLFISAAIAAVFYCFPATIHARPLFTTSTSTTLQNPDEVWGEKTRLGSTPPSCHNKCNECNPCKAVQVPTLPSHDQSSQSSPTTEMHSEVTAAVWAQYSNYKPLGWKCTCGNHLFNP